MLWKKELYPSEDVKLALAARPAGLATPASASSSLPEESETPPSSSPSSTASSSSSSTSTIVASSCVSTTTLPPSASETLGNNIVSVRNHHPHYHQQQLQQQQSNPSPAYTTYSNASTATTFAADFSPIVEQAVFVPFEGGCMAREHYWPTGSKTAQDQEKRALAAEQDRQVRLRSAANDIRLDLPVSVARPDGEEYPTRARLRSSHDKRYEIQKPYIQGPPNKTVWDSKDCLDWTVTQPSSSSSRSGGSKSTSKSSSSHWGLSWSRSNKSPPSQGRSSRGQQRHPHASNPSTSVRNSPSSCETGRGSSDGGGAGGIFAGSSLLSSFIPSPSASSPNTLGSLPNSSPLGFHGAATSSVAGDTVHCAFPNHNHQTSHSQHPPLASKPQQQQPLVFSGGGAAGGTSGPSIAERLSEKVQHCTNAIVGNHTRTSPNNNASNNTAIASSSSSSSSTNVLSRLIDPESKLFSRGGSKDSKRSSNNNGKNGKSHRTEQSSSASSSPGGSSSSLATMFDCSRTAPSVQPHPPCPYSIEQEQLQQRLHLHHQLQQIPKQQSYFHHGNIHSQANVPVQSMATDSSGCSASRATEASSVQSPVGLSSGDALGRLSFFTSVDESRSEDRGGVGETTKRSNNVMMPLKSKTPDNNNPVCSSTTLLSGGSRSSYRTGPSSSSSSSGVPVRMMTTDAYCGADVGAIHNTSSDNKGVAVVGYPSSPLQTSDLPPQQQQLRSNVCVPMTQQQGQGSVFSDCENGNNARVPVVKRAAPSGEIMTRSRSSNCGIVDSDTNNTLTLSHTSSWTKGEVDDTLVRDEEMKGVPPPGHPPPRQQQQQPNQPILSTTQIPSSNISFDASQQRNGQTSSSVPSSSSFLFNCSFPNAGPPAAAALLPTDIPPTRPATAATTTASVAAAESTLSAMSSCCSVKEKGESGYETCTFSPSGCSTDPNYSTFAKINHNHNNNRNCCTPHHQPAPSHINNNSSSSVQSQYLDVLTSSNDTGNCNNPSSILASVASASMNRSNVTMSVQNNENNNFSMAQGVDDDEIMTSESSGSSTAAATLMCSSPLSEESMMVVAESSPLTCPSSPSSGTPSSSSSSAMGATTSDRPSSNNNCRNASVVTTSSGRSAATTSNVSDYSNDHTVTSCPSSSNSTTDTANSATTTVRETAHHCELSETFIASKNDTDQYCTAAATAELITTSLHSPTNSSPLPSSSSLPTSTIGTSTSKSPALSLMHQQQQF